MIETYITIPTEVEALKFSLMSLMELVTFTKCTDFKVSMKNGKANCLVTIDGATLLIVEGSYIVKDSNGTIRVFAEDIFNETYIKKE